MWITNRINIYSGTAQRYFSFDICVFKQFAICRQHFGCYIDARFTLVVDDVHAAVVADAEITKFGAAIEVDVRQGSFFVRSEISYACSQGVHLLSQSIKIGRYLITVFSRHQTRNHQSAIYHCFHTSQHIH